MVPRLSQVVIGAVVAVTALCILAMALLLRSCASDARKASSSLPEGFIKLQVTNAVEVCQILERLRADGKLNLTTFLHMSIQNGVVIEPSVELHEMAIVKKKSKITDCP